MEIFRIQVRAVLNADYACLYDLARDELRYILNSNEAYGKYTRCGRRVVFDKLDKSC